MENPKVAYTAQFIISDLVSNPKFKDGMLLQTSFFDVYEAVLGMPVTLEALLNIIFLCQNLLEGPCREDLS